MRTLLSALIGAALSALAVPSFAGNVDVDVNYPNYNLAFDGDQASGNLQTCGVADMNGDGNPDLILQAPSDSEEGRSGNGSVFIFYGPFTGTPTSSGTVKLAAQNFNIRIDGASSSDNLGWCLTGDFNNDGYEDLLLQAPGASGADYGSSYVIYGPLPNSSGTVLDLNNPANWNVKFTKQTGFPYPYLADVNGDGIQDLVFEAPGDSNNGSNSGSEYLIYGGGAMWPAGTGNIRPLATTSSWNLRFDGPAANVYLGSNWDYGSHNYPWQLPANFAVGDLAGTGVPAMAIGCPGCSPYGRSNAGTLYISTGPWPSAASTGNVRNLATPANFMLAINAPPATSTNYHLPEKVAIADFNGDGKPDLCLGSGEATTLGRNNNNGVVYCINGPISTSAGSAWDLNVSTSYNVVFNGDAAGHWLGSISLGHADLNNDGVQDLIMESFYWSGAQTNTGAIYVVYGGATNFPSSTGNSRDFNVSSNYNVRIVDDASYFEHMTEVPTIYRDMDGDGITDLVINGYDAQTTGGCCYNAGRTWVMYGPLPAGSGTNKSLQTDYDVRFHYGGGAGGNGYTTFGWPVQTIADFDRDGLPDFAFPFYPYNTAQFNGAGRVFFYSMAKLGPQITAPVLFSSMTATVVKWNAPNGGSSFRVQVGPDPLFLSPVFDQTFTGNVQQVAVSGLTNGQTYYARVEALDGNYRRWSPPVSFTVAATPLTPPILYSPGNNSGNPPTINTQTPQFNWSNASSQ